MAEPSRSVEVELKFDVDASTPLPDWGGLPGVESVVPGDVRDLDARYLDTAALALGRAGYAVRRRTGGPDEGWHIKGPRGADGGRVELHWPLTARDDDVPEAVRAAAAAVASAPLAPIARIRNRRAPFLLLDAAGGVVAEFVDDRVTATDERSGAQQSWREWEFELGPAAPASAEERAGLFAAATDAVRVAGGRVAASDSKLARTLGLR